MMLKCNTLSITDDILEIFRSRAVNLSVGLYCTNDNWSYAF